MNAANSSGVLPVTSAPWAATLLRKSRRLQHRVNFTVQALHDLCRRSCRYRTPDQASA